MASDFFDLLRRIVCLFNDKDRRIWPNPGFLQQISINSGRLLARPIQQAAIASMENHHIEAVIARIQQDDDGLDDICELLAAIAEREQRSVSDAALQQAAQLVADYIVQVPYVLQVASVAAEHANLSAPMEKILISLRRYWEHDEDLIPDNMGMLGLLDDAYCSRSAMQAISDQYRMLSGKHLFPFDMRAANQAVRKLLGEPYAADLDRHVMDTLNAAGIMPALHKLADGQKKIDLESASSLWHHDATSTESLAALVGVVGN